MAASAAAISFGPIFKTSLGARFFVAMQISITAEEEEYKKGGIALPYSSLGLPDSIVDSIFLPAGLTDEKSEKQYDALILKEKLILFAGGKEKTFNAELTEAEGKALKGWYGFLVALGR